MIPITVKRCQQQIDAPLRRPPEDSRFEPQIPQINNYQPLASVIKRYSTTTGLRMDLSRMSDVIKLAREYTEQELEPAPRYQLDASAWKNTVRLNTKMKGTTMQGLEYLSND